MKSISAEKARTFTAVCVVTVLVLFAGVAAINAVVDPFGMFRIVTVDGVNAVKPAIFNRVRLMKAYDVRRLRPRSIILGSSRVHLGLSPSHRAWGPESRPVYNLAFDGATTKEMYHYLRHAHAVRPLRQVVLGLDTYHPTAAPSATRPGFNPQLLYQSSSALSRLRALAGDAKLLFNLDTLRESVRTLRSQDRKGADWFADDGQRLGPQFFRRPTESYTQHGPRHYFDEIDKLEVRFQLEWRIPPPPQIHRAVKPQATKDAATSLDYIERIVRFCRAQGVDLRIFITPSHVHQLEIAAAAGSWPSIENGKRALVKMLAANAATHGSPFPLWDFSGYSAITTEALPPVGSHVEMWYYWDSSHFKQRVGDRVLQTILSNDPAVRNAVNDFGVRLSADNIERELEKIRRRQELYRQARAEEIGRIRRLVDSFARENGIMLDDDAFASSGAAPQPSN